MITGKEQLCGVEQITLRPWIQTQQIQKKLCIHHISLVYLSGEACSSSQGKALIVPEHLSIWGPINTESQTTYDRSDQQLRVCERVHLNVHVQYLVIIKAFLTQGAMLWDPPTWRGPRRRGTEFVCECGAILLLSAMMLRTQESRWSCSPEFTSMIVSPKWRKPSCDTDKLT